MAADIKAPLQDPFLDHLFKFGRSVFAPPIRKVIAGIILPVRPALVINVYESKFNELFDDGEKGAIADPKMICFNIGEYKAFAIIDPFPFSFIGI